MLLSALAVFLPAMGGVVYMTLSDTEATKERQADQPELIRDGINNSD